MEVSIYKTHWIPEKRFRFNADRGGFVNAKQVRVIGSTITVNVFGLTRMNNEHWFLEMSPEEALTLAHHLIHAVDARDTNDSAQ